jgi:hypothetical protein
MILNEQQLTNILTGALITWTENGEFRASRFTEKQLAYYARKNGEELLKKAYATASMTLDFMSDADAISFDWWMKEASSRRFYHFDLYVDGVMCDHYDAERTEAEYRGHVCFGLPEGTHRVTLYLPNLMATSLKNVVLENATFAEPCKRSRKFYFVGDSITQGYDAIYPSMSYVNRIARCMDADVLNQAVGSEIFDANIPDEDLPYAPDLVAIAYGTNDWARCESHKAFICGAAAFFERVRSLYSNAKIVYISPIFRGEAEKERSEVGEFFACARELHQLAEQYGFFTVDGMSLVPHLPSFYSDLTLHPNDLGFSFYAENLGKALSGMLA